MAVVNPVLLVTGGAGNLGSHTVVCSVGRWSGTIVIADDLSNSVYHTTHSLVSFSSDVRFRPTNFTDARDVDALFADFPGITAIVHAAHSHADQSADSRYHKDLLMAANLFRHVQARPRLKVIIPIPKRDTHASRSTAATVLFDFISHLSGRQVCIVLRHPDVGGAHPGLIVGEWPVRPKRNVISRILDEGIVHETDRLEVVHVMDLGNAIGALLHEDRPSTIVDLEGCFTCSAELAQVATDVVGAQVVVEPITDTGYPLDTVQTLDWRPNARYSLRDMLQHQATWHRKRRRDQCHDAVLDMV